MTNFWWVNQGKSFEQEIGGGYMWAPKKQRDGNSLRSYDLMLDIQLGDVVFSHYKGKIVARGFVTKSAISSDQPLDLLKVGEGVWNKDGWLVEVEFVRTPNFFSPKEKFSEVSLLLLEEYPKPIASNGNASQKNYLTKISPALAVLINESLAAGPLEAFSSDVYLDEVTHDLTELVGVGLADLPTEKWQEVLARRGQGVFRSRVRNFEKKCRVTGVQDPRLLIASHIKPWKDSTNLERLNGANGLMLSPHVDNLFDAGLMTFGRTGKVFFSSSVANDEIVRWHLDQVTDVGKFSALQTVFLEFHNDVKFKS
jgi:hypothetical protein